MLNPERMNRIHQQNMFGKNILTLEDYFSKMQDSFFNNDKEKILHNSRITHNGKLTPRFRYLIDYVNE